MYRSLSSCLITEDPSAFFRLALSRKRTRTKHHSNITRPKNNPMATSSMSQSLSPDPGDHTKRDIRMVLNCCGKALGIHKS